MKFFSKQTRDVSGEVYNGPAHEILVLITWRYVQKPLFMLILAHMPYLGVESLSLSKLCAASSEGSGETARLRSLVWAFAARTCVLYQNLIVFAHLLNSKENSGKPVNGSMTNYWK